MKHLEKRTMTKKENNAKQDITALVFLLTERFGRELNTYREMMNDPTLDESYKTNLDRDIEELYVCMKIAVELFRVIHERNESQDEFMHNFLSTLNIEGFYVIDKHTKEYLQGLLN